MNDEKKKNRQRLVIAHNNCASNDPCALCGRRLDAEVGPELFLPDGVSIVCWKCGKEHAPELVAMLRARVAILAGAAEVTW